MPVWRDVLTGITGLPARRRRSGQAASAGAALVAGRAVGLDVRLSTISIRSSNGSNRIRWRSTSTPACAGRSDRVAQLVMALTGLPATGPSRRPIGRRPAVRGRVRLTLAYGVDGLAVEVPDDAVVVEPREPVALADEAGAVRQALRSPLTGPPLGERIGPDDRVVVVFPDITRPMPNTTVLPPLLAELERAGAGPERVTLLCATGTHRPATAEEMTELVGAEVAARYRIHDHRADDGEPCGWWARWTAHRYSSTVATWKPTSAS